MIKLNGVSSNRQYYGTHLVYDYKRYVAPPNYFFVENITNENETLSIVKLTESSPAMTIEYSTDKINWSAFGDTGSTTPTYTLAPNEKLYLRASAYKWGYASYADGNAIRGVSKVGGNIMSLLYGSSFTGEETTFPIPSGSENPEEYIFTRLFQGNTRLKTARELIIPVTTLTPHCFHDTFNQCSNLEEAPKLPAENLVTSCYEGMFSDCSSLRYIECLAVSNMGSCTGVWMIGVPGGGVFVKNANATDWQYGSQNGIPEGWTVQDA